MGLTERIAIIEEESAKREELDNKIDGIKQGLKAEIFEQVKYILKQQGKPDKYWKRSYTFKDDSAKLMVCKGSKYYDYGCYKDMIYIFFGENPPTAELKDVFSANFDRDNHFYASFSYSPKWILLLESCYLATKALEAKKQLG